MTLQAIPAIDLLDQKVVRLTQGRYDAVTFYDYGPVDLAIQFEQAGAKRLHLVDLNGARDGSVIHGTIIEKIRSKTSLSIEVGGGIRNKTAANFYLNAGVNQLILGSLFVSNFTLASELASQFKHHIIAGVDAKQDFVATDGWESTSQVTLTAFIETLNSLPLHSIIYTDIAKDGMLEGPNIEKLKLVSDCSQHPIIASGGIRGVQDIQQLRSINNVKGFIIGKALLNDLSLLNHLF